MSQEFFKYLPSELIIDILSRLPVKTIISCKYVCKSWLKLLASPEFVKSHLSKSKPGLVFSLYENDDKIPSLYHIIGFERNDEENNEFSFNTITVFDLMEFNGCREDSFIVIEGSVNGLLFCQMIKTCSESYYICNPITREYIVLPSPQENVSESFECCGFGVSKMTGQHKVVRVSFDRKYDPKSLMCEVYTLGTGSWRTIAPVAAQLKYNCSSNGALLNGNLHWLVSDLEGRYWISCFDLETEQFTTFSAPVRIEVEVIVLGDCLCLFEEVYGEDEEEYDGEIIIWSMKEYGVSKSWTKEYVFSRIWYLDGEYHISCPINVFKDGDILMALDGRHLLYYSSKSKTGTIISISELPEFDPDYTEMLHCLSFLSLKSFVMEDVKSF